jgi:pyridoxine/pyridoxamine 5'-phosphate oxidase
MSDDLQDLARAVIDTNKYLTLGTTEPDGGPRVSPVYFTHADHRDFYWVSSPTAQHSLNVAAHPTVALVVFDSTVAIGKGRAVYVGATAEQVPDEDLPAQCARAFARIPEGGARAFAPSELSSDAPLRLYRARAKSHDVHIPGGDPVHGTGIDRRQAVDL